ncbi:MAG: Cof-type HAD-IIB family hydrolase [Bacteroidota bacterium]|nr:Cof-type HAD-IIB family hydrolase [Bacteroidota bacterium]
MYKAVFIDIDGTLIRKDHSLSVATINTIQKLKEKNILVVLVSARPLSGIEPIAEELHLLDNPIASLNGAYIADKRKIIFNSTIDADRTERIHESLEKFNSTIIYYQQDKWLCNKKTYYTDYEQKITSVPIIIQPFNITLDDWKTSMAGPNKILIISKEEVTNEIQNRLRRELANSINVSTSKPIYLEAMNINASKVKAVKFLSDRYNIKREETIAIGDNFNDIEMIEFAGIGIAMGNAPAAVKTAADHVTGTNNEDGVSSAIERFIA